MNLFYNYLKIHLKKHMHHLLSATLAVTLFLSILVSTFIPFFSWTETIYAAENPNMSNLVVFVNFSDTPLIDGTSDHYHSDTALGGCFQDADYTFELFNGEDTNGNITNKRAMKQYLDTISYGQLRLENVFPQYDSVHNKIIPLTLSQSAASYANSDEKMISEIISILNADYQGKFPNTTLDYEYTGILDNLMIVVACDNDLRNELFSGRQSTYGGNETLSINSVNYNVRHYTLVTEGSAYFGISGSGLLIHEFMHTLGYPDLYHNPSNSQETTRMPVGTWDIMSQENYNVQYPLAYMRQFISGWLDLPTITTDQKKYTLTAASATNEHNKNTQAVILKTPYSENEFFVIEYRKKGATALENPNTQDYDSRIPGSGIIIYRVNTSLQTNILGAPFMVYVYRPNDYYDDRGLEMASSDSIHLSNSYLSAESGRTSYGSSDASKTLSDNAITYSDGTNSGIVISNVGSANGDTITFDISFTADSTQYWTTITNGHPNEQTTQLASCMDNNGMAYYIKHEGTGYSNIGLYQFSNNTWTRLGNAPSMYNAPQLTICNKTLYMTYVDTNSYAHLTKWNGNTWTNLHTSSVYAYETALTTDGSAIYFTYNTQDGSALYAYKHSASGLTNLGTHVGTNLPYAANPSIAVTNGNLFIQYREFFNKNTITIKQYNSSTNNWTNFTMPSITSGCASLYAANGTLYLPVSSVNESASSYMYTYDLNANARWTKIGNSFTTESSEMDLCIYNTKPYLAYIDSTTGKMHVVCLENNIWTQVGTILSNDVASGLHISNVNNALYVTYLNAASNKTYLRTYTVEEVQAPENSEGENTPTNPDDSNTNEPTTPDNSNNNGATTTPDNSNNDGSTTSPDNSNNNGATTSPDNSNNGGSTTSPDNSNNGGSTTSPDNSNNNGATTSPDNSNNGGSTTSPDNSNNNGSTTAPDNSNNGGSTTSPDNSNNNGSTTAPDNSNNGGSTTSPDNSNNGGSTTSPDNSNNNESTTTPTIKLHSWVQNNGRWYYYRNNVMVTGWLNDAGSWYYMNSSGTMITGWLLDGNCWYFFDNNGVMKTGWINNGGNWYYMNSSGAMITGWLLDGNCWYFFDNNGVMKTGWVNNGGNWYYMNSSGSMITGWLLDGNCWYFFDNNGVMKTGWVNNGANWYYMNSSGAMITGWLLDGNNWYFFDINGIMTTGWVNIDGDWYYMNSSGVMATGWILDGTIWYFLDSSGRLVS